MNPALTPDEWGRVTAPGVRRGMSVLSVSRVVSDTGRTGIDVFTIGHDNPHIVSGFVGGTRHAIAALALHGQPFGFTRTHLEAVRLASVTETASANAAFREALESLAARIEAILPPEVK